MLYLCARDDVRRERHQGFGGRGGCGGCDGCGPFMGGVGVVGWDGNGKSMHKRRLAMEPVQYMV